MFLLLLCFYILCLIDLKIKHTPPHVYNLHIYTCVHVCMCVQSYVCLYAPVKLLFKFYAQALLFYLKLLPIGGKVYNVHCESVQMININKFWDILYITERNVLACKRNQLPLPILQKLVYSDSNVNEHPQIF